MVAMDPNTGQVLAMVGGYSFSLSNFNRATQAYSPAWFRCSSQFVYVTALETGQFTPASIVLDAPITLPGFNGQSWSPENYEHNFLGPQIFRRGLELSLNAMTVRIAMQIGMPRIAATAIKFGVVDKMEPVLAMALGAGETTPFRITAGLFRLPQRRAQGHAAPDRGTAGPRRQGAAERRPARVPRLRRRFHRRLRPATSRPRAANS